MEFRKLILLSVLVFQVLVFWGNPSNADNRKEYKEGRYLVIEGRVSKVVARSLVIEGQQYPISMFAQVYDKNGGVLSVQNIANVGKIDRARVYILGGKVEKIIVLHNV